MGKQALFRPLPRGHAPDDCEMGVDGRCRLLLLVGGSVGVPESMLVCSVRHWAGQLSPTISVIFLPATREDRGLWDFGEEGRQGLEGQGRL